MNLNSKVKCACFQRSKLGRMNSTVRITVLHRWFNDVDKQARHLILVGISGSNNYWNIPVQRFTLLIEADSLTSPEHSACMKTGKLSFSSVLSALKRLHLDKPVMLVPCIVNV